MKNQYKIVSFLSFCTFFLFNYTFAEMDKIQLKGCIESPLNMKKIPEFSIFFAGIQTMSNEDGIFSFPATLNQLDNISILICEEFWPKFQKNNQHSSNTIYSYRINRSKPYKYFTFKIDEENKIVWQESILKNNQIPENCVIIIMNPEIIDSIEDWDIPLTSNIKKLAKINLKEKFSEQDLYAASTKSLIGVALDARKFHAQTEQITKNTKTENLVKTTIIQ